MGQGDGEASCAAPDVEDAAIIRRSRELRKRTGEQPRPPPEKPLVGGPSFARYVEGEVPVVTAAPLTPTLSPQAGRAR